jgi:L-asparaginase
LLIGTGGTIGGHAAGRSKEEQKKAEDFAEDSKEIINALAYKWGFEIKMDPVGIPDEDKPGEDLDVDSSDILPKHWRALAELIKEKYDDYESFIITHGTNTLGYTCAALTFAIANSNKPIILTGSQVPFGDPGTDALTNLSNALRVAVWPRKDAQRIRGVLAVFGSHIITGCRVKKDTEFDYDAFKSFTVESIGRIGRIININENSLAKHLKYLKQDAFPEATGASTLEVDPDFDMNIASLTEFPGMNYQFFETLVEHKEVRGFVLRAFGAGDPSNHLRPAFEYLKGKGIPIVVTTQAPNGNSNFQVNDPGKYLRDNKLAIPAYDMSVEAQTTKLAWLLAKRKKGLSYDQLCKDMITDIRGEINVMWEVGN